MQTNATSKSNMVLTLNNVEVIYDYVALALKGASLEIPQSGMVALLGANGAGKSTLLKSISGLLKAERGEVTRTRCDACNLCVAEMDDGGVRCVLDGPRPARPVAPIA